MSDSVFKNPQAVREQMNLPAVIEYSFVGLSSPEYQAKLESIVVSTVGEDNIRNRSFRESSKGSYTAYKYSIFHDAFEVVEELYRLVMELEGTRFVL